MIFADFKYTIYVMAEQDFILIINSSKMLARMSLVT